jgi:methylglutamate dehydrogenase subunit C
MSRLDQGGLIDRRRALNFAFDGRELTGYAGDTLASALIANDVSLVGRSFKYHRPRGIFAAGPDEPNALVELRQGARREANTRATVTELYDGLVAASQNRWPSLGFDLLAVNRLAAPLLGAGFYYKTFMWPAVAWEKLYEPLIRRAAGLGRAADLPDPDQYEKAHAFCDLLVIGAGPAGLMAALTAARAGARVVLADEDFQPGGRLNAERHEIDGAPAGQFVASALAELESLANVRIFTRTTVFGIYDSGTYGLLERVGDHLAEPAPHQPRQRLWKLVARRAILAAGAAERPIVFGDNDRPGIMLAQAFRTYVNRYAALPAARPGFFVNNDAGWRAAFESGATTLIDVRKDVAPTLMNQAKQRGIRTILGGRVVATEGKRLRAVEVESEAGREQLAVDGLAISGGFSPNVHLTCHHGGRPVWDEALAAFLPGTTPPGVTVAGAAAGRYSLAACLADGAEKSREALSDLGFEAPTGSLPRAEDESTALTAFWHVADSRGSAFVDFQNDVTAKDVATAHGEGFRSVEHLKRYTTLGMATDQGKTSNVTGLAIMASLTGQGIAETGTTIFRPPYTPVAIGALAGHHRGKDFRPTRPTPTHGWARDAGAVFVESGPWLRAQYFPKAGERDWLQTVTREVEAVRSGVGLIDVSTFGKIDLQGRDVGAFLDRVYINSFSTLAVGKVRYGVMLREDGMVLDDGTTARLGDRRYLMTTTTANAAKVYQHLEFCLQVLWLDLDVRLASISEQWAQIAVAGPRARHVLQQVVDPGTDVGDAVLPYMGVTAATVLGGVKARIFRVSFSGELGYEIAVPARQAEPLARALMAAGAPFGITPYGIEALGVMRIEKGHVSGNELSGQTTAGDLGLGRMASTKKDYIGCVMMGRPGLADAGRPTLVGFKPVDRTQRLRAGAHFIGIGEKAETGNDQGHMTSVAFSPSLGHWIGLGLLARGPARLGEVVRAYDPVRGLDTRVEICSPVFLDPKGERLRG